MDWREWHQDYADPESALGRRLVVVQTQIRAMLDRAPPGPIRAIGVCGLCRCHHKAHYPEVWIMPRLVRGLPVFRRRAEWCWGGSLWGGRYNHSSWRNARSVSGGWYLPGLPFSGLVLASARSLIARS